MGRSEQVARILKVISLLELNPDGLSAKDIHSRVKDAGFDCELRTIYRDFDAISAAHFPITNDGTGDQAIWKLNSIASLSRNIQFSYRELIALFLSRQSLQGLRGSPLFETLDGFFGRLEQVLGPRAHEGLESLKEHLGFKSRPTWQTGVSQEVLDTVHSACVEGMLLQIDYKSISGENRHSTKTRTVGPEAIHFADAGAYLIAKDFSDGIHKLFALSRISAAVMLENDYNSEGFSADDFLKDGIGVLRVGEISQVEIHIADPIASYVSERRWHESQQITRVQDGLILRMNVRLNDDLVRWVLSLGSAARVEKPEKLRSLVQEEAEKIVSKNGNRGAA